MAFRRFTKLAVGARRFSAGAQPVLVVAEHDSKTLSATTRSAITAASQLGQVEVLVMGKNAKAVTEEAATVKGVKAVVYSEDTALENGVAENVVEVLADLHKNRKFSHIVAPASSQGRGYIPRLGATLDVQPITDVTEIRSTDTFVRPMYAGNAMAVVKSTDSVKLMTVRPTSFEKAGKQDKVGVKAWEGKVNGGKTKWVSDNVTKSERPQLTSARVVVSGGRGMKSGDNFKMLAELADTLGGALGASRAAVDAGFVPNDMQVGQTGKVVAPELYIAVGISGAIQHLAGMKDSKTIVAINKDAEAPIFQVADYGLVADLFTAVPALTSAIKAAK